MKKQKKVKKRKEKTVSQLTKELDRLFSLYIRGKYPKECYTCGYKTDKLHAGHYISRYYKVTRWDENNVRPQCFMCNIWKKGNASIFRANLVRDLGEAIVQKLEKSIDQLVRGTQQREHLLAQIAKYDQKY